MSQTNIPGKTRPHLESLPREILQSIFLHSLEVNLPRASAHLSRALSNQLLYTWLIRLAFSSTNPGSREDFFTSDFLPPPLDFWSLSWEDRQQLQTALLTCRWCTLPLIRKCQREYVHHAIRRKCGDLAFAPEDRELLHRLDSRFENLAECDNAAEGRRGKGDLVIPAQLQQKRHSTNDPNQNQTDRTPSEPTQPPEETTHPDHKLSIWLQIGAIQIRPQNEIYLENNLYRLPSSQILKPGRIPNKLLRRPWSDAQFEFLTLLAQDFYLDEDEHEAERSALITTRLIRKRRIEPFKRLLRMYFRSANCRVPARWPLLPEHFEAIMRFGVGNGDPFAGVVLEERWGDIPVEVKEDLVRYFGRYEEFL
ncbi:hypothetical protein N7532_002592 [Penicillium argentinense]|uniref:Uncharacterized protein n=1 Tax=Penicillium argentinense TaxID=1131581 RepID=A0A9W9G0S0_9EURO|nr:uncharacterized protein N7532_002592 [Penicillium argentinense]KAJ5109947.1 hypothetical protein N7532_002592 [Penicillium argentinense]